MANLFPDVSAGDLIRAEDFNALIRSLNDLEDRVTHLEGSTPGSNPIAPVIDNVAPSPVRVGQDLQVVGSNFGISVGANRILFGGIPPTAVRSGSTDSLLIAQVPPILGLPDSGNFVTLAVSNQFLTATRDIFILPPQFAQSGEIDILFDDASPDSITAGMDNVLAFRLHSRATQAVTMTIGPKVDIVAWQGSVKVLDQSGSALVNGQITIAPLETKQFAVRLSIPAGTNGTEFTVRVDAAGGGIMSSSGPLDLTVGQAADPDTDISLSPSASVPDIALTGTTIAAKSSEFTTISMEASFKVPGRFNVDLAPVAPTTNWILTLTDPAPPSVIVVDAADIPAGGTLGEAIQFRLRPSSGATDPGQARVSIQKEGGGGGKKRTLTFDLHVAS